MWSQKQSHTQAYVYRTRSRSQKGTIEISKAMETATKQKMESQGATPAKSAVTNKVGARQGKRPCYHCGGRHSPNDSQFK